MRGGGEIQEFLRGGGSTFPRGVGVGTLGRGVGTVKRRK